MLGKMLDNGIHVWPDDWPLYVQAGLHKSLENACDILVGPCACGAWHQLGEFSLRPDGLYRFNRLVDTLRD